MVGFKGVTSMHITCEGRSFDFFDGASPQNLWNIVRGERGRNDAVLADCNGDILDFQTPFQKIVLFDGFLCRLNRPTRPIAALPLCFWYAA